VLLIYLSIAWVTGILLGSLFSLPPVFILTGLIPLLLLPFFRHFRKQLIAIGLCLILLFSGIAHFNSSLPVINENHLSFYNDRDTIEITGLVEREPEPRDSTTHLYLSARAVKLRGESHRVTGMALLYTHHYPEYHYGDIICVTGILETPPQFGDFDYKNYLAGKGIYSTMPFPKIEIIETGKGLKPLEWLYRFRSMISRTLSEVLPEPQASLSQGIILGMRSNIPPAVRSDFAHTGTAHLLAISGLHLSIIAGISLSLGIWFFGRRRYVYVWMALGTIWFYTMLTGMHPPVLRGAIMASLFLTTELLGRQRSANVALAFAASIMVGITPRILWDASFQMSFMAMAGLIFFFPLLQPLFRKVVTVILGEEGVVVPVANFIADSLSVSLGAIIAVWPLIAYYFDIVSPVAPLATLFALPALPGIIISGAMAGIIGIVFLPVAQIIAWFSWLFTSWMLLVVNLFSVFPYIEAGAFKVPMVLVYYSVLVLVIWFIRNRSFTATLTSKAGRLALGMPIKWIIPPLVTLAILVLLTAASVPDSRLRTSFLNVGQGDAVLVQKGSQQILIDGGPSPQAVSLELGRKMPFWDRTIDLIIFTHPHADHLTGLIEVLKRYKVKHVLFPQMKYKSPLYDEWLRIIEEKDIEFTLAQSKQLINLGSEVSIIVLNHPQLPLTDTDSDIDNNGLVLRLEMGKMSLLITGDIMWQREMELIAGRSDLSGTVLKVAHHGSATSTTDEFLARVDPLLAVISVAEGNSFGHPSVEVMDRLQQRLDIDNIFRTDKYGTIEIITDGERLWVKHDKKND